MWFTGDAYAAGLETILWEALSPEGSQIYF